MHNDTHISPGAAMAVLIAIALIAFAFAVLPAPIAGSGQTATAVPAVTGEDPFAEVSLGAKAAFVFDIGTGAVLYEKNPGVQLPLASLTKVALALAVAEVLPLDSIVTIPYYARGANGEHLEQGERWSVRELMDFTLAASSNEGAEILANLANDAIHERYPASPADGATLWRMNDLIKEIGLEQTFYLNASGLDLSETQASAYGSARDMAKLFAYAAVTEPSLFAATTRESLSITSDDGAAVKTVKNTNVSQGKIAGLIMGKTGFTDLAGGNLAVVFDAGLGQPFVAVVLGSTVEGRFDDIKKLVSITRTTVVNGR